jgi:LuxR family maltose regulon positive regulatory protein
MVWWLEIPALTYCRALLAIGTDADLQEAEEKLLEYLELNEANHNTCQMIHVMLILSLTYRKQERPDEALAILEQAVVMAEPGRWVFPFIELGPQMAEMLRQLRKKNAFTDYIDRILDAFSENEMEAGPHPLSPSLSRRSSESEGGSPSPPGRPMTQPLVEPLTNREIDILELLEKRLQTKEIAEELCVSPETVKSHLRNIYQKLNAKNRREAVEKAKSLRIL